MALFEAGNGGGADVGRDSEASSPVSASFGVLTFCCIYRGGRRIEHKLNSRKKAQGAQRSKPQPMMNCHERSQRSQKLKNINSCPCALCVPLWQRFCFNCTTFRDRIAEVLVVVCYTPSESLIFTRIFYHRGVRVSPRNHVFRPTTATMQVLYVVPRTLSSGFARARGNGCIY
jgi:hypothetical protein